MSNEREAVRDSELWQMAERFAAVLATYRDREIKPEDVDMRMVADFCYALGVTPSVEIRPLPHDKEVDGR